MQESITKYNKAHTFKNSYFPWELGELSVPAGEVLIPKFSMKVACGLFGIQDDFIESYQSIDSRFIKNKNSTFFFEAEGDSMEPTIFRGEILLVDRSITEVQNRVCIVALEGELLCKRVVKTKNGVVLISDNPKYKDILITNAEAVEVWGVVTSRHGEV
ncbi:MAG: hypothetical protein CME62_07155 [Halobacteriovoraceae bacterium]|nr:hypothetical protein [Halobacteriovoraceae bacterium]|tara:strand:+ start:7403 stop:7879 length:477 start_codon:yes stop_codon:yes gene_type:complete